MKKIRPIRGLASRFWYDWNSRFPGDVREKQVALVDHFDEAGLPALGRRVAIPFGIGGGHHGEGGVAHKLLHPRGQVTLQFGYGPVRCCAEFVVKPAGAYRLVCRRHGECSFVDYRSRF